MMDGFSTRGWVGEGERWLSACPKSVGRGEISLSPSVLRKGRVNLSHTMWAEEREDKMLETVLSRPSTPIEISVLIFFCNERRTYDGSDSKKKLSSQELAFSFCFFTSSNVGSTLPEKGQQHFPRKKKRGNSTL